ncbi:MAG: hypothetical protein QM473_13245 [Acidobacteriota bacterium]|nr:hypothetical protein [Acidobacteriota bacterium]
MRALWPVMLSAMVLAVPVVHAQSLVIKEPISDENARQAQLINNGDLAVVEGGQFPGWKAWELGYEVDAEVSRSAPASARCVLETADQVRGMTYVLALNQTHPTPIVAECWSKAEGVSGGRDSNYSLYLDLEYMDGTPLWGQVAPFRSGTHDWEMRTVTVVPTKPIKNVSIHGIFRLRTGTAWFDDFKCWELSLPEGARQFDSVGVGRTVPIPADRLIRGLGLAVRDVAAGSGIMSPAMAVTTDAAGTLAKGEIPELNLQLEARFTEIEGGVRVDGRVRDTTGRDRAVTVYAIQPLDALGWNWHQDARSHQTIAPNLSYRNWISVGAGSNGMASWYPLACVSNDDQAAAIGAPMDVPRLYRFAYESASRELYAAADLGLSPDTAKFPSSATFSFVAYTPEQPSWGFRSALAAYYRLFPGCFTKRNAKEGIWMPFTDISSVGGFEDFGFQFQEGAPNPAFDEEHGIYSFVYVEPMSHWLAMPEEMERTDERAIALIKEQAARGMAQSQATLTSAIEDERGEWQGGITKAPWCDGALYLLNPSPNVPSDPPGSITQFEHEWGSIERAFRNASTQRGAWRAWERGFAPAPGEGRDGSTAIRVTRAAGQTNAGASQSVQLGQKEPAPLVARVWTKADDVSGEPDNNYALYIDLTYADGTPGWGFVASAPTGTGDWQLLEQTIRPAKPVTTVSYHLLLRAPHEGTVWFDDAFLGLEGSDENLLRQPDFEPIPASTQTKVELDGTYIDSYEMAATNLNYRREHFTQADIPLVYDTEGRVCQLGVFNTIEFSREVSRRMLEQGKMMFANSTPIRFPWPAAHLDVMGIETNWARGGQYHPNPDATLNYWRAICYQRPYLLLQNTVYEDFKPEWVELYFKRCAAYGIFPSFFSHNAADDPYWRRPNLYDRDRPLFKQWIPVISALSAAGWEPVTHARSDDPKVYVERFGKPGGPLYLTVFNDSQEPRTAKLTAELEALGVTELPREWGTGGVELAPEDVAVIRLR